MEVDRKFLAAMLALLILLSCAWAWQSGRLDGLARAASAKLRDITVASIMNGPYGTMTREMAERIYDIMRKRPEQRAPEEVAYAYNALMWTGQLDRAEEFVAPTAVARQRLQVIREDTPKRGDKHYFVWQTTEAAKPPGNSNPDRAVVLVTYEYWYEPSPQTRAYWNMKYWGGRGRTTFEYPLARANGAWVIEDPIGKGHGDEILETCPDRWPPAHVQPWPPR
ncbi:MAG: hypothetical protein AB1446_07765 [Bacillota bacterium]